MQNKQKGDFVKKTNATEDILAEIIGNELKLENYKIISKKEDDIYRYYIIETIENPKNRVCPKCSSSVNVVAHCRHEKKYVDSEYLNKQVRLNIKIRRYKCRDCNLTFSENLPDVDDAHRVTARLAKRIKEDMMIETFASVARRFSIDEKTIRNVFKKHVVYLAGETKFDTPMVLGVDEVFLRRNFRVVITNVQEKTLIEMLEVQDTKILSNYLGRLDNKEQIKVVTIDMCTTYLNCAKAMLPRAIIVVDRFHVVAHFNKVLDSIRVATGKKLKAKDKIQLMHDRYKLLKRERRLGPSEQLLVAAILETYPELKEAYRAKEGFLDIYDKAKDRKQAEEMYEAWLSSIPKSMRSAYGGKIEMVNTWKEQIFNYFDHRFTNAFTESFNRVIRQHHNAGRGYSFEVLRARMLYYSAHRIKRVTIPPRRRQNFSDINAATISWTSGADLYGGASSTQATTKEVNYGVPISTFFDIFGYELEPPQP